MKKNKITVFVFGNPDEKNDSLPLQMIPEFKKKFPEIDFVARDPNEECDIPEEFIVIDTAEGIDKVTVFDDIDKFAPSPRVTMHDFDVFANLQYLKKLGKLRKIKIIGVPPMIDLNIALEEVSAAFASLTF